MSKLKLSEVVLCPTWGGGKARLGEGFQLGCAGVVDGGGQLGRAVWFDG